MPDLNSMVGEIIVALVPIFHKTKFQQLKLHGVEDAGVWVENQAINDLLLAQVGVSTSPKTLIVFLPWHQISFVLGSYDAPSLSEKGFGV